MLLVNSANKIVTELSLDKNFKQLTLSKLN